MSSDLPPPYTALTRHPMMPRASQDEAALAQIAEGSEEGWALRINAVISVDGVRGLAALDNPWLRTIGMRESIPHPDKGQIDVLASPIKLDGQRLANRAAPTLGADSDNILEELGYSSEAIAQLRSGGVI